MKADHGQRTTMKRHSGPRRAVRRIGLLVFPILALAGYMVGAPWLALLWDLVPPASRRQLAIIYLDGLLVGYAAAVVAAAALVAVVGLLRLLPGRSSSRGRAQARLLAVGITVVLSVLALDGGAAAWSAWLHRTPSLPDLGSGSDARGGAAPERRSEGAKPVLPDQFPTSRAATAAALRILVIGESSARGDPYYPWLSVGQIVGWKLERVLPGRPVQVDIWATGGATLANMHNLLARLTYRPDAMILYVGHNEFQSRYPWIRDVAHYYADDVPSLYSPEALTRILRHSPLCRLVLETWESERVSVLPPRAVKRELVDRPMCTASESALILADFQRRLEAIARYCDTIGTLLILVIPPSNDGGYDPSRSALAPETPAAERVAFARAVEAARALENTDAAAALRLERALVERHPEFAETHYRLARLLEQTGDWTPARDQYAQARECDGMPMRCPEAFRRAYRAVAERHPAALLVDGPKVLEAASPHGILDDRFFHDAQHPNLRGYVALSQYILDELHRRGSFGWPEGIGVPRVDADACARHFGLDASRWIEVCKRAGVFYRMITYFRYDPKFRNQRAAAYRLAGEAIASGTSPGLAGIPGLGMLPRASRTARPIPSLSTGLAPW
jgi:hypothetical protein